MTGGRRWGRGEFARDSKTVARALLGQCLVRVLADGTQLSGMIVETEAYLGVRDKAAHSYGGRRTARNESMYGRAGTAYVYFTYGMHHCANVVCGRTDEPVAVLIRALMPLEGAGVMRRHRRAARRSVSRLLDTDLGSGPAKLCQALAIDRELDGVDLVRSEALWVEWGEGLGRGRVGRSARIGIGYAEEWAERPLRWFLSENPHVSR